MSYNNTCKIRLVLWKACEGAKPITLSHRASWEQGEAEHRCCTLTFFHPLGKEKTRALTKNVCWGEGRLTFSCFALFLREKKKIPICLKEKKNCWRVLWKKQCLQQFLLKVNLRFPTIPLQWPLVLTDVWLESAWANELILNEHQKKCTILAPHYLHIRCFLPNFMDLASIMQLLIILTSYFNLFLQKSQMQSRQASQSMQSAFPDL